MGGVLRYFGLVLLAVVGSWYWTTRGEGSPSAPCEGRTKPLSVWVSPPTAKNKPPSLASLAPTAPAVRLVFRENRVRRVDADELTARPRRLKFYAKAHANSEKLVLHSQIGGSLRTKQDKTLLPSAGNGVRIKQSIEGNSLNLCLQVDPPRSVGGGAYQGRLAVRASGREVARVAVVLSFRSVRYDVWLSAIVGFLAGLLAKMLLEAKAAGKRTRNRYWKYWRSASASWDVAAGAVAVGGLVYLFYYKNPTWGAGDTDGVLVTAGAFAAQLGGAGITDIVQRAAQGQTLGK
jgi:hypothetical protein